MAQIKYVGFGNRELAAADLKKVGVEGFNKKLFIEGQSTEIDDAAAKAILENEGLFGRFETVTEDDSANQLEIPTDTSADSETNTTTPSKASRKQ